MVSPYLVSGVYIFNFDTVNIIPSFSKFYQLFCLLLLCNGIKFSLGLNYRFINYITLFALDACVIKNDPFIHLLLNPHEIITTADITY